MSSGIAIKIDEDLFRDFHIRAVERGESLQDYVTGLIRRDLFPEKFQKWTEEQLEEVRAALEQADIALQRAADMLETQQYFQQDGPSLDGMSL